MGEWNPYDQEEQKRADQYAAALVYAWTRDDIGTVGDIINEYKEGVGHLIMALLRLQEDILETLAEHTRDPRDLTRRPSAQELAKTYVLGLAAPPEGYTIEEITQPCYVCGGPAHGRDPQGRPHHPHCQPDE